MYDRWKFFSACIPKKNVLLYLRTRHSCHHNLIRLGLSTPLLNATYKRKTFSRLFNAMDAKKSGCHTWRLCGCNFPAKFDPSKLAKGRKAEEEREWQPGCVKTAETERASWISRMYSIVRRNYAVLRVTLRRGCYTLTWLALYVVRTGTN